jgi:UDP-N-acetylmuramoyl-L-alanyl-D-glutamate--2,6-diaminopimelate ligase
MRLSDVLRETTGVRLVRDASISGVTYDSRAVKPGFLFVAIPGTELDGREFIPDAAGRGASAVVTESDGVPEGVAPGMGFAAVPDARRALSQASNLFYGEPSRSLLVVGVTGTKGKTTVCHLVKSVLDACGEKTGLIGTVHNIVGDEERPVQRTTPESTDLDSLMRDMVDLGSTAVVMEVSSHALALQRVEDILFDVAVFTNIGRDHLDFHKTMEGYASAKRHLFEMLKKSAGKGRGGPVAAINADDPYAGFFTGGTSAHVVTYGLSHEAQVRAVDAALDRNGTVFTLSFAGRPEQVRLPLPGRFNMYNAMAAASVAFGLGKDPALIAAGLRAAKRVRGRVEVVQGPGQYSVWVDYAHTPESLRDILVLAREMTGSRVIAVFGCGGDRDSGKRPVMGKIAGDMADFTIVTDDNPRTEDEDRILDQIEAGLKEGKGASAFMRIKDRKQAIAEAIGRAGPGDIVVLAGKGHETYQQFKDRTVHFDDVEEAQSAMRSKSERQQEALG